MIPMKDQIELARTAFAAVHARTNYEKAQLWTVFGAGVAQQIAALFGARAAAAEGAVAEDLLGTGDVAAEAAAAEELGAAGEGKCLVPPCPCFVARTLVDADTGGEPIESVHLGDRVGPELEECDAAELAQWREVDLAMTVRNDGVLDEVEIHLL